MKIVFCKSLIDLLNDHVLFQPCKFSHHTRMTLGKLHAVQTHLNERKKTVAMTTPVGYTYRAIAICRMGYRLLPEIALFRLIDSGPIPPPRVPFRLTSRQTIIRPKKHK